MNIRGIAVAIAFSICVSGCEGPKGEPGAVGPAGELWLALEAALKSMGRFVGRDCFMSAVVCACPFR
jgi:hypothetical protein